MKYPDVIITTDYKTWKKMKCGNYQCHGLMKSYQELKPYIGEEYETFQSYHQEQTRIAKLKLW